ncbi:MAG: STAS domain-containing protein [Planctomycetota bacterium]
MSGFFGRLSKVFGGDDAASTRRTDADPPPGTAGPARVRPELASFDLVDAALIATVACNRLYGADAADLVETILDELEQRGEGVHVIVDLQNVELMDSSSLGMLVFLNNRLGLIGGRVAVVNASCGLEEMFRLTQLDRMLPVCRDVMKAVAIVNRRTAA